tara:strand:- start:129 stop:428 length:300 start_codon:yes stop_codon:yes gene_type:complete
MNWKDIVASNERDDTIPNPNLEKVISALELLYGNRRQVIESNILGVQYEEDLGRVKTIDKDYILDLIEDIRFAYNKRNPTGSKAHLKAIDALKVIYRTL